MARSRAAAGITHVRRAHDRPGATRAHGAAPAAAQSDVSQRGPGRTSPRGARGAPADHRAADPSAPRRRGRPRRSPRLADLPDVADSDAADRSDDSGAVDSSSAGPLLPRRRLRPRDPRRALAAAEPPRYPRRGRGDRPHVPARARGRHRGGRRRDRRAPRAGGRRRHDPHGRLGGRPDRLRHGARPARPRRRRPAHRPHLAADRPRTAPSRPARSGTAGSRLSREGLLVYSRRWLGEHGFDHPLNPINADPTGLGPLAVFSGTLDILTLDAPDWVDRLRAAGVDVEYHEAAGQVHVYPLLPTLAGRRARRRIVQLVRDL